MPVIDLRRYIVASTGVWTDPAQDHNLFDFTRGDTMSPERLLLRWAGDFVALTGPLRVRVTVQAGSVEVHVSSHFACRIVCGSAVSAACALARKPGDSLHGLLTNSAVAVAPASAASARALYRGYLVMRPRKPRDGSRAIVRASRAAARRSTPPCRSTAR